MSQSANICSNTSTGRGWSKCCTLGERSDLVTDSQPIHEINISRICNLDLYNQVVVDN